MVFPHERALCGVNSQRSDTLTIRVTGVNITVFCSAVLIDVTDHCHTAGALGVKRQKTVVPIIVWLVLDPFRPLQNHMTALHIEQNGPVLNILSCMLSRRPCAEQTALR